jgi:hypothetical protein
LDLSGRLDQLECMLRQLLPVGDNGDRPHSRCRDRS